MTKDEICGLLRQIHDVLAMQSETNQVKPVAWMDRDGDIYKELPNEYWNPPHTPIYTKREWVGLEQSDMPSGEDPMFDHKYFIAGMVYADKVLKEKNT
jgi:hypothetical protein